ncbi:MAG: hypothetical protein RBS80_05715 [Thermoguttaceae bacterium]|jgi:hypothetical protein|nr:hypothetical protein [Thermoguttaceae bacterium]
MAKQRTPYQQGIIRNYYRNRDTIAVQRLGELVTDLYLAEGKARERLWQRATVALENLGVSKEQIDHLVCSDDPALLARQVERLMQKPEK